MNYINSLIKFEELIKRSNINELREIIVHQNLNSSNDFITTLERMKSQDRRLKIGIIGKVKAGKSSLINALVFEGKDILPKAATPMTAALTKIYYSEKYTVNVDFFDASDLNELKTMHGEYEQKIQEIISHKRSEFNQNSMSKSNKVFDEDRVRRQAAREITNETLTSAYQQYQKILEKNLVNSKFPNKTISVNTISEMQGEMTKYVGADGQYMPITRAIEIGLPYESLIDIEIIDTPGLNDAVASREQRTHDMLRECDVVFIVSQAGQFLTEQDIELANRLSQKEGIQEIYLVASQVDNQLFSFNDQNIENIITQINTALTEVAQKNLSSIETNPILKNLADNNLNNRLVLTSSVIANIINNDHKMLDSNAQHILNYIKNSFDYLFQADNLYKEKLALIYGVDKLLNVITDVKMRKAEIQEQRIYDFEKSQINLFSSVKASAKQRLQSQIKLIEDNDINSIAEKREFIRKNIVKGQNIIDNLINRDISDVRSTVLQTLRNNTKKIYSRLEDSLSENQDTEVQKTGTVPKSGFWNKTKRFCTFGKFGYEDKYEDIEILLAKPIYEELKKTKMFAENDLWDNVEPILEIWQSKLVEKILHQLTTILPDQSIFYDVENLVSRVVSKIYQLEKPVLPEIPAQLVKSSKLEGSEAKKYVALTNDYIAEIKPSIEHYIESFKSTFQSMRGSHPSSNLFTALATELDELERQLGSKTESIKYLADTITEINSI